MTSRTRRLAALGLTGWAATLAFLTLVPAGAGPPEPGLREILCFWCTTRPGADLVLNWVLFVPGGFLLRSLVGTRRTLLVGLAATVGIEAAQVVIPGRNPALADLLLNAAGMASGAWLRARGLHARTLAAAAVIAAAAWIAPSVLLLPRPTSAALYAVWTPEFGGMARYSGTVLDAEVGGLPTRLRVAESDAVAAALATRAPVEVRFVAGTPTPALAPLFGLYDEHRQENLLVAVLGSDLLVRNRTVAATVGLDRPDIRWVGGLDGVAPGDTLDLRIRWTPGGACMSLAGREACGVAPTRASGYAFLLNLEGAPRQIRLGLALLWSLAIGVVVGLAGGTTSRGLVHALVLAGAGVALDRADPDLSTALLPAAVLVAGAVLGAAGRGRAGLHGAGGQPRDGEDEVLRDDHGAP